MKLTETPDIYNWPASHYVFIEKKGPFQQTAPQAWQELHSKIGDWAQSQDLISFASLYKVQPEMVYRAGVMLRSKPESFPPGFSYEKFEGGKYSRFTLTGSYSQLPEASGRVFDIVKQSQLPMRAGYFIENYANDPKTTPEDQLITEIMIPTR